MYERLSQLLLRWLRVPPQPPPPHGDPASLRVFHAGKNHLNLRYLRWGGTQLLAFAGIIFWFGVFSDLEGDVENLRSKQTRPKPPATAPAAPVAPAAPAPTPAPAAAETSPAPAIETPQAPAIPADKVKKPARRRGEKKWPRDNRIKSWLQGTVGFLARLPGGAMFVIWFFEIAGLVVYFVQLPLTFIMARLDYEKRWYMVTDRSLRIRHGVWRVAESTMSFANIQQVVVSQGPLQRALGLSDVKVQSAGGGGDGGGSHGEGEPQGEDMHLGLFHNVTNPQEIRDLILERLRHFRESGLGDPDEKTAAVALPAAVSAARADALAAAHELRAEAKALRTALS